MAQAKSIYLEKEVIESVEKEAKKKNRSFSYIVNERLKKG